MEEQNNQPQLPVTVVQEEEKVSQQFLPQTIDASEKKPTLESDESSKEKIKKLNSLRANKKKIYIYIMLIISFVVDVVTIIFFFIKNYDFNIGAFYIASALLQIIYFVIVKFSDLSYKYSFWTCVGYVLSSFVLAILPLAIYNPFGPQAVFTTTMTFVGLGCHLVTAGMMMWLILLTKKSSKASTAASVICNSISFGAFAALTTFVIINSVTGQINGRTVVYRYLKETDSYEAVRVMNGVGDTVILDKFNGKDVTQVNGSLLKYNNYKYIKLKNPKNIKFVNISDVNPNVCIVTDYENGLQLKKDFYTLAYSTATEKTDGFEYGKIVASYKEDGKDETTSVGENLTSLANNISFDLDTEYKSFINFTHTLDEVVKFGVDDKNNLKIYLPLASKTGGDVSSFTNYVEHYENSDYPDRSEINLENLTYNYSNLNKILQYGFEDLKDNSIFLDSDFEGKSFGEGTTNLKVKYKDIYKVTYGKSNDTKYEETHSKIGEENFVISFDEQEKKTTSVFKSDFDMSGFLKSDVCKNTRGEGYELGWEVNGEQVAELDPNAFIENNSAQIKQVWRLKAPEITDLKVTKTGETEAKQQFSYGSKLDFHDDTYKIVSDTDLSYSSIWKDSNGNEINDFSTTLMNVGESGTYSFFVTVGVADSVSSLPDVTSSKEINITITPKEATLNWTGGPFTYDGTVQYPTATVTNLESGDTVEFNYSNQGKDAGTHNLSITSKNPNYVPAQSTYEYSISPKDVTLNWSSETFVYNGMNQHPTATIDGLISGDTCGLTYTEYKDAGSYTCNATCTNSNYRVDDSGKSFDINKKEITPTWNNTNLTYNGYEQNPTVNNFVGLVGGDTVNPTELTYTGTKKDAGSGDGYTTTVAFVDPSATTGAAKNYVISSNSTNFVINPAVISITWTNLELEYTAAAQSPTGTANTLGSDTPFTVEVNEKKINVGNYTGTVTASTDHPNYDFDGTANPTFSIVPATLTLEWDDDELIYNKEEQHPEAEISSGKPTAETATLTIAYSFSQSGQGINAGTYVVTASVGNGNYVIDDTRTKEFTIKQKEVIPTWDDTTTNPLTFNGLCQYPNAEFQAGATEITDGKFYDGDDYVIIYNMVEGYLGVHAGTHKVKVSVSNDNYFVKENTSEDDTDAEILKYDINKFKTTVLWDSVPDNFTYNTNNQAFRIGYSDVNGIIQSTETKWALKTDETTEVEFKNAGEYIATAVFSDPDYEATDGTGGGTDVDTRKHEYKMKQYEAVINWEEPTLIYNGSPQSIQGSYISLLGKRSDITYVYKQDGTTLSEMPTNGGTYSIIPTIVDPNYKAVQPSEEKTFTINKKMVDLTWDTNEYKYKNAVQTINATFVNINGEIIQAIVSTDSEFKNAGDYIATASISDATDQLNYDFNNPTKDYKINKAYVAIELKSNSSYSNEALKPLEYFTSGDKFEDWEDTGSYTITPVVNSEDFKNKKPGNYIITAQYTGVLANEDNYTVVIKTSTYTIIAAPTA